MCRKSLTLTHFDRIGFVSCCHFLSTFDSLVVGQVGFNNESEREGKEEEKPLYFSINIEGASK